MGWDDIQESKGGSADFVKLESGKSLTVHILDKEPFAFSKHWAIAGKQSYPCKGPNCPYCAKPEEYKKTQRFAVNVYNLDAKSVQVLEQGKVVFGAIKSIWEAYDKDLSGVDMKIGKTGSGLETEYSVVPVPTKFKEDQAKLNRHDVKKIFGVTIAEEKPQVEQEEIPF